MCGVSRAMQSKVSEQARFRGFVKGAENSVLQDINNYRCVSRKEV